MAAQPALLLPCGTATVDSWGALQAALTRLQPDHARVLITLSRNISVPADPAAAGTASATCGGMNDVDGDGDDYDDDDDGVGDGGVGAGNATKPQVVIYRNVTLVGLGAPGSNSSAAAAASVFGSGGGSGSGVPQQTQTELNLSCRRSLFQLRQPEPATAAASGGGGGENGGGSRVVLTFADLALVNVPVGPRSTWPVGLVSAGMWHVGMNR